MSASREKNKRKQLGPVSAPAEKKGLSKGLKTAIIIACVVVIAAAVVFFSMMNNGFFARHSTAAVVSDYKLTPVEYNYCYYETLSQYSSYLSMLGVDTSVPLDEQIFDETTGQTWAEYLQELALESAADTFRLYNEATKAGFQLSEESRNALDSLENDLMSAGLSYGVIDPQQVLQMQFGVNATLDTYKEYFTKKLLASDYCQAQSDSFSYTAEQLAAEYAADPSKYDSVTYRSFNLTDAFYSETASEERAQLRKSAAAAMADTSRNNEQAFLDSCVELAPESSKDTYSDPEFTLKKDTAKTSVATGCADWLFDTARQEGDVTVIDFDTYSTVLYFISRENHDYKLPNLRYIAVEPIDTEDESSWNDAFIDCNEYLNEYEAGEKTADSFLAVCEEFSGIAENVTPGVEGDEFDEWVFEGHHMPGDTTVVRGSNAYYVLYYDGEGENYRDLLVEAALRQADYSDWYADAVDGAGFQIKPFGMFIANR